MVLTPAAEGATVHGEYSPWVVLGMLCCLLVVIALGVHLPGELVSLLHSASRRLALPVR